MTRFDQTEAIVKIAFPSRLSLWDKSKPMRSADLSPMSM